MFSFVLLLLEAPEVRTRQGRDGNPASRNDHWRSVPLYGRSTRRRRTKALLDKPLDELA